MKALLFITTLIFANGAFAEMVNFEKMFIDNEASYRAGCASNTQDIGNISALIAKANPWGTWSGNWDGKTLVVTLSKASGSFTGTASYNGSNYGPNGVTICDNGGSYTIMVMGYQAALEILSSKKIRITSPLDANDKVTLTKN